MIRLTEANYADGVGAPAGGVDPVTVSSELFDQDGIVANSANLSNLFVAWGQFTDHDLTLTAEGHGEVISADGLVAPLTRADYAEGTGVDSPRMPMNELTWQMDGSQIYGSTTDRTNDLRSFEGGHLRTGENGLMPNADADSFMAGDITSDAPVFLAGDIRANENPALSSVHTLMMREHNYWADRLAEEHPDWTDEQLFNGARQIVEVEIQQITYNEWLPHLIGDAAGEDTGFDPDLNGQISVEFATAGFRFGHTMVSSSIDRINDDGTTVADGNLSLQEAFFNPDAIRDGGIEAILRGQAGSVAQEVDTQVVDDLNFFLSTPNGMSGFSLVGLNLLRGQDLGLQSYVDTRAALLGDIDPDALDPLDFSILTDDPDLQAQLASVYPTVHDVELWVGGLAEDAIDGTQFGPLFTYIVADQFGRTRGADETFGALDENLGADIIAEVRGTTFSDIILRNTEIDVIQDAPFVAVTRSLTDADTPLGTCNDDQIDIVSLHISEGITTKAGADHITIIGGSIVDGVIKMGIGNDTFNMSSGTVAGDVKMNAGDDTVSLSGTAHLERHLQTGQGDDMVTLSGHAQIDGAIQTGAGNDVVSVGANASVDAIHLGRGNDTVTLSAGADVRMVRGGENDGDNDTLIVEGPHRIDWENGDPDSGNGTIVYLDANGNETGETTVFRDFESVTCFTAGTRIITARGMRLIDDLQIGDLVYTLDAGMQPIRWIGRTTVPATRNNAPIQIAAGALGNARPLQVSPQHRMLVSDWRSELVCGTDEVLVAAKHLINDLSIRQVMGGTVDYIHILFDDHQIVMAEGIASESFHPGRVGLGAMAEAARQELLGLFPQLAADLDGFGPAARYSAKASEAILIARLARV
jgi:peroxidase